MAFDQEGYDVVSVVPIAVGRSEQVLNGIREYLGDVGFSITAGAVVVGKKRE